MFVRPLVRTAFAAVLCLTAVVPAAAAEQAAVVSADLNLRAGPGVRFGVILTIPRRSAVEVEGCVAGTRWCAVSFAGVEGYAFADYLIPAGGGRFAVVVKAPVVPVVPVAPVAAVVEVAPVVVARPVAAPMVVAAPVVVAAPIVAAPIVTAPIVTVLPPPPPRYVNLNSMPFAVSGYGPRPVYQLR